MRSTAAPYTESRLARLVRNKRVGFPVVEQKCIKNIKAEMKGHSYLILSENVRQVHSDESPRNIKEFREKFQFRVTYN